MVIAETALVAVDTVPVVVVAAVAAGAAVVPNVEMTFLNLHLRKNLFGVTNAGVATARKKTTLAPTNSN